jgi:HEAT repeat protein
MIKRLLIGFTSVILLLFGLGLAVPDLRVRVLGWLHGERFARGWPTSHWVATLADQRNLSVRRQAAEALQEIGPPVVPAVIAALKERGGHISPEARGFFLQMGPEAAIPLAAELVGDDQTFRRSARGLLLRLGPDAQRTVPMLGAGLANSGPTVRRDCARILARIGPAAGRAGPALAKALADPNTQVRREAAAALGLIGAKSRTVRVALIRALLDAEADVRRQAAEALGKLGPGARSAVPALITCLNDKEAAVREKAAWALGQLGPEARPAAKCLARVVRLDRSLEVRRAAAGALGAMGRAARAGARALLEAAFSPYLDLSGPAGDALAKVSADPAKVAGWWERILVTADGRRDAAIVDQTRHLVDRHVLDRQRVIALIHRNLGPGEQLPARARARAALLLAFLDPRDPAAVPGLVRAFQGPSTRADAKQILVRLGPAGVQPLCLLTEDGSARVRAEAVAALGRIQPPPRSAIPALVGRLGDRVPDVAQKAQALLNEMVPRRNPFPVWDVTRTSALLAELGRPLAKEERCRALYELSFFHIDYRGTSQALRPLLAALKDRDRDVRRVAAFVLGQTRGWFAPDDPLRQTLTAMLRDRDPALRAQAVHAFSQMFPPDAETATIIALFKDKDPDVRWQAVKAFGQKSWLLSGAVVDLSGLVADPDRDVRREAIRLLGSMGPTAQAAVPKLIPALRDPDGEVRIQAISTLGNLGPAARPAVGRLVQIARSADLAGRLTALYALGHMGPAAAQAVPGLRNLLNEQNDELRRQAAWALGAIGVESRPAVSDLTRLLKDRSVNVRVAAAEALWQVRREAGPVVRFLRAEFKRARPGSNTRGLVAGALGRIGPPAREAIGDLVGLVRDKDTSCRCQAIVALGNMGPATRATAEVVLQALTRDPQPQPRAKAANVVQRYGPVDVEAVGPLAQALGFQAQLDRWMQRMATNPMMPGGTTNTLLAALGRIGPVAKKAVPNVIPLLKSFLPQTTTAAIDTLGHIGPGAREAIPALVDCLSHPQRDISSHAALALPRIDPLGELVVPKMIGLLNRGQQPWARSQAITVLARIGKPAKNAVPKLRERFTDPAEAEEVRLAAARALWKIARSTEGVKVIAASLSKDGNQVERFQTLAEMGPDAREAIGTLVAILRGRNQPARAWALYVLGRMGPAGQEALPALMKELADTKSTLRMSVLYALAQIGPAARAAVPELRKILKTGPTDLRRVAATALAGIGRDAREAVPELTAALHDKDPQVQLAAAGALWLVDGRAKDALHGAEKGLQSANEALRQQAVSLLGRMGQAAREAEPALRQALDQERNMTTRLGAADALWRVSGKTEAALPLLRAGLKDPFQFNRVRAARVLGDMGGAAKQAVADLRAAALDPDAGVREAAARALEKIGPK